MADKLRRYGWYLWIRVEAHDLKSIRARIYGAWQLFKPPPLHATGDSAVPGGGK